MHGFVESVPETIEPGFLSVSLEYERIAHSWGSGEQIVTPLTPTDWNITYDGETVGRQLDASVPLTL